MIIQVAVLFFLLCQFVCAEEVEFGLELAYDLELEEEYLVYSLEEWPASIEAEFTPAGSEAPSWAGIAFSLSGDERIHEALRLGVACDPDRREYLQKSVHRDDRIYLYLRSELEDVPGIIRLMYPVARSYRGYRWYPRLEWDNARYSLLRQGSWQLSLHGDFCYSTDPKVGFDHDLGLRLDHANTWLFASESTLAVGWSSTDW